MGKIPSFPAPLARVPGDLGLLIVRLIVGGAWLRYHAVPGFLGGWRYFFGGKKTWPLMKLLEQVGLNPAVAWACLFSFVGVVTGVAVVLGFFSRVGAALLAAGGFLLLVKLSPMPYRELGVVYIGVMIMLTLTGPGLISLDSYFSQGGWKRQAVAKWKRSNPVPVHEERSSR
jgi:uncharacterized membrane protein YphA (DoxX/SURF4 family)